MSYPPLSSYDTYYEPTARSQNPSQSRRQSQSVQNTYNHGRSTSETYANEASYPRDVRQAHYNSSTYDWAGETQQGFESTPSQQQLGDSSLSDANAQRSSFGNRRQSSVRESHTSLVSAIQGNYQAHPMNQTTQGLNSLVHASGLDDSGPQRQGNHNQQSSLSPRLMYSSAVGPDHTMSPAAQNNVLHSNSNRPSGYGYQNKPSSVPSQSPHMSAAATALAAAVSRRYSKASASPVFEASSVLPTDAAPQKPVSPFYQSNLPQSQRRPSTQAQQTHQPNQTNSERGQRQEISQDPSRQNVRAPSQGFGVSSHQLQQPRPQDNSISRLVTHSMEEYSQSQYSATMEPNNVMPHYIDPAQVFNPYAREHERRRKAAEEEAKRKAEDAAAAVQKKEQEVAAAKQLQEAAAAAAAEQRRKDEMAKQTQTAPAQTAPAKSEATNPITKQQQPEPPLSSQRISSNGAAQTELTIEPTEPSEPDMAAELKAMMEKMKKFRSKDPELFQKLWDDLRKPTASLQPKSPSPEMVQATRPSSPSNKYIPTITEDRTPAKFQQPTPAPTSVPLNGYKVIVENNPEGMPDLGRFPADPRIRTSYNVKKGASAVHSTPAPVSQGSAQAAPPPDSQPGDNLTSPPIVPHPSARTQPAAALVSAKASQAISLESPTLTQGLPPRAVDGGTVWPKETIKALAEAAVNALKSNPANKGLEITLADIHKMLETNLSYIDLCERLEARGFKFQRGQFARQLLSKVPRLNEPKQKGPPTPSQAQLHTSPGQQIPPTVQPIQTTLPAAPSSGFGPHPFLGPLAPHIPPPTGFQSMRQTNVHPINAALPPGSTQPLAPRSYHGLPSGGSMYRATLPMGALVRAARPDASAVMKIARREPPQGTKEAMARKRDFSEIVDLTALSDDEDYVLSHKQAKVASASPEHDPFEEYQKSQISSTAPPTEFQPQGSFANGSILTETTHASFNPKQMPQQGSGRGTALSSTVPAPVSTTRKSYKAQAKPINKNEALQKSYYNPKTVARDILIAAGRHPTERPLNAHMAGLLGRLIDIDSDLSTFDWDAIDPGGPEAPQVALVEIPMEPPRYQLGHKVKRHEKTPEPRLPNLDKRNVPAPEGETVPQQGQHFTPTIRYRDSESSSLAQASSGQHELDKNTLKRRRRDSSIRSATQTPDRCRSVRSSSIRTEDDANPVPQMATSIFPTGKKRGRPPGSKNGQRSVAAVKPAADTSAPNAVTGASQSANPMFRCRWRLCAAHLHNFETLQHHVSRAHCPSADEVQKNGYLCWWKKCRYLHEDSSGLVTASKSFDDKKAWLKHIEEDHLYNVALRHGDGPSTKHIGKHTSSNFDVSRFLFDPKSIQEARTFSYLDPQTIAQDRARYLSDEHGRSTTPVSSMKTQSDLEPDAFTLIKADSDDHEMTAQRSFMRAHRQTAKNSPKALAEETLRAMSARKTSIGPGLERAGAILVTEERRKTLIQNQGLARVVDFDY
ncbi:hypothetical protein PV08_09118 [Exophiala spinifera]|uniref:Uncharacterized protein n=1 Tax=Exophiala spinifera TaxID=91928 RepID=A0A0D2AZG5_9EURO|nr:uncharacterized protein PV08_09118 [Exophiala spinifera]KIW11845.1 hypothetical protein PV08_09118 [Exophiala spinifera]